MRSPEGLSPANSVVRTTGRSGEDLWLITCVCEVSDQCAVEETCVTYCIRLYKKRAWRVRLECQLKNICDVSNQTAVYGLSVMYHVIASMHTPLQWTTTEVHTVCISPFSFPTSVPFPLLPPQAPFLTFGMHSPRVSNQALSPPAPCPATPPESSSLSLEIHSPCV